MQKTMPSAALRFSKLNNSATGWRSRWTILINLVVRLHYSAALELAAERAICAAAFNAASMLP